MRYGMNSLLGLLAAPTAAKVADMAGRTAKVAATPFELLLKAAVGDAASTVDSGDANQGAEESEDLEQQVARQLQELLSSLGVGAGERVTLRIDDATGEIKVDDNHPAAAAIEEALR